MANIDKNKLDKVFRLTDEADIYDFLKDEVYRNASLAKKLIKEFLPDDTEYVDFRYEVESVFLYADESDYKYGPSMDWHQISDGLYRMISKAKYLKDKGKYCEAADIACQIITSVGKEYCKDCVYANYLFDGDHFYTDESVDMLIELIEMDVLDIKVIKSIHKEIQKAAKMKTYKDYCICNFDMLLCVLDGELSSPEVYLRNLDEKIATQRDKYKWILRKNSFLQRKGMNDESKSLAEANFGVPEISRKVIDVQIRKGNLEDSLKSIDKALKCTSDNEYSYLRECHTKRIKLCEKLGIVDLQIEDYSYLIVHGNSDNMYECYQHLKTLMPEKDFKIRLKTILEELMNGGMMFCHKHIAKILAEENDMELLCKCLTYNDKWDYTEGFEIFREFASVLSSEQRKQIVLHHIDVIRNMATTATAKDYSTIRYQMEQLLECCDEASPCVGELKEEFRDAYKRRPAFMKQLDRLK